MDKIVLYCVLLILGIIVLKKAFSFRSIQKEKNEFEKDAVSYLKQISDFYAEFRSFFIKKEKEIEIASKYRLLYDTITNLKIKPSFDNYESLIRFIDDYKNLSSFIEKRNKSYLEAKANIMDPSVFEIDGKTLDKQQRNVVLTEEDRVLVVAGAGSGKTLTIAGKVKYLCEVEKMNPKDILLVTFTKKAAEEMTERIADKMGYPISATTFHKLGLDIIKNATNSSYDVLDDMREYMEAYFNDSSNLSDELIRNLITFFAYYLNIPADLDTVESLGEAYENEKSANLETLKSQIDQSELNYQINKKKLDKITIKNEHVKSLEEVTIANFLFLHGINYEYEYRYPFQDENSNRKVYRPDFFLPDYNLYLEHFGINEEKKCPWLSKPEEEKYIEDMNWKVAWHKTHETTLLQTYSYYQSQGILLEELDMMLKQHDVIYHEVNYIDIFNALYESQSKRYFSEFISLCCSFITLFKSNQYEIADLDQLEYSNRLKHSRFHKERYDIFKNIIRVLLSSYNNHLKENNAYDFSDMINISTRLINDGYPVHPYRYVIIDEYQDISVARYKLIHAILNQTKAKLLCVGDDWQSIYRFAGSDISLFTDFEKYFGNSRMMKIEKTYRNSQDLIDEAGRFIMKNPRQISKSLKSDKVIPNPIVIWNYDDSKNTLSSIINQILSTYGLEKSILLLGRTNYDFDIIKQSGLFYGKSIDKLHYIHSPETPISFLTVHKSKGLEADNVILLNFENSTLGFPNKIADDPLLQLVLSQTDDFLFAEERRLFYVALTRTKNQIFVMTKTKNPSLFLRDMPQGFNILYEGKQNFNQETLCPKCKTGHLVKRKNEKTGDVFFGCSNYPQCDYTTKEMKSVENQKICPLCGDMLVLRYGKNGAFYGCNNYPRCSYTEEFDEVKICPVCGNRMKLRKGKNGFFWGCESYPHCNHTEAYK